ncbi:hypothetical protein VFPPC_18150 [Pochonia chlamydosporia 170]|uniref:Uncharacterized protein n=1 Tax=Pochonia chlamydosporia 170 TaxID=1380566 RepID=A0A219API4_METCM|nr:hypothetical protein VFPPC_18150 [Pochonia chlamydosporia 170]OWT42737.1 hypothetical protein VFPPC_18150 [Pochonia chlamydosporia 170]
MTLPRLNPGIIILRSKQLANVPVLNDRSRRSTKDKSQIGHVLCRLPSTKRPASVGSLGGDQAASSNNSCSQFADAGCGDHLLNNYLSRSIHALFYHKISVLRNAYGLRYLGSCDLLLWRKCGDAIG